MRTSPPKTSRARARTVNSLCPTCGSQLRRRRGALTIPVNGEITVVPGAAHLACAKCGEQILDYRDAADLQQRALVVYREKHGLLSGEEIRAIREQLALTQAGLAALLRLGPNTISRWESGRNVQTAAMDLLLRMVRDVPASLNWLRSGHRRARRQLR